MGFNLIVIILYILKITHNKFNLLYFTDISFNLLYYFTLEHGEDYLNRL